LSTNTTLEPPTKKLKPNIVSQEEKVMQSAAEVLENSQFCLLTSTSVNDHTEKFGQFIPEMKQKS
jgi:hypothetical protein